MFIYQINVEYLGTNFVGWQFQKNGVSVQEVLEKALSKFLKDKIKVIGSGRTDAGVHAKEQSAHFKTKRKINDRDNFINSMNFFLKKYPVSILNIRKRSKMFHARHSAKKRTYKYFIINRFSTLVLDKKKAWHVKKKLNTSVKDLATSKERDYYYSELISILEETGFVNEKNHKSLLKKVHIIFNKAMLEKDEINILHGMLASIRKKLIVD